MRRDDVLWADGLLVEARDQANPSAQDAARNLAGVQNRLGSSGTTGGDAGTGAGDSSAASAGTLLQLRPGGAPAPLAAKTSAAAGSTASGWKGAAVLGRWLAFGATTALIGYLGGRAESQRELERERQTRQLELAQQVQQMDLQQREHRRQLERAQTERTQRTETPQQPAPAPHLRSRPLPAAPRVAPRATPQQVAQPQRASASEQLREAIELLQRAEAALRQGDAFAASLLLSDLERSTPAQLLREERLVTRTLVSCALGDEASASAALLELEQLNPESIYRARLEGSCAEKKHRRPSKEPPAPH